MAFLVPGYLEQREFLSLMRYLEVETYLRCQSLFRRSILIENDQQRPFEREVSCVRAVQVHIAPAQHIRRDFRDCRIAGHPFEIRGSASSEVVPHEVEKSEIGR